MTAQPPRSRPIMMLRITLLLLCIDAFGDVIHTCTLSEICMRYAFARWYRLHCTPAEEAKRLAIATYCNSAKAACTCLQNPVVYRKSELMLTCMPLVPSSSVPLLLAPRQSRPRRCFAGSRCFLRGWRGCKHMHYFRPSSYVGA